MSSSNAPLLKVEGLDLAFGGFHALTDVDFEVPQGGIVGLVGPNGAGKSSLLNVISGLYIGSAGTVTFQGEQLGGLPPWKVALRGVARTFQNVELVEGISLSDNVMLGMHQETKASLVEALLHVGRARTEERAGHAKAAELLELVGLGGRGADLVNSLSFAEKKLVEIARALMMSPTLMLLDEPASGMSAMDKTALVRVLRRLREQSGLTQVLVEHDMAVVSAACDSIVVLDAGKIIAVGPPLEVLKQQNVIDAYLGREE
ncbi:MAG: ABC transporter ATP-binding protein [Leucobacter sp.]|jgi:ABC-type branched-subunit amino acid transport system ATPase component|nr:ABC transporter ATP-binding protein [Leucobacter sp.]